MYIPTYEMSVIWIPITLAAAGFQTARTALQHRLRSLLSVSGAGFVRYVSGAPLSLAAVVIATASGVTFPSVAGRFWPTIAGGGIGQILGTICLIRAFDARDFVVGTVFAKTEVVQIAIFSMVVLGESLRWGGWIGVAICMIGVTLLAASGQQFTWARLRQPAARYGLAAGGPFGIASIGRHRRRRARRLISPSRREKSRKPRRIPPRKVSRTTR